MSTVQSFDPNLSETLKEEFFAGNLQVSAINIPSGYVIAIENDPVDIVVIFPLNMVDLSSSLCNKLPEGKSHYHPIIHNC